MCALLSCEQLLVRVKRIRFNRLARERTSRKHSSTFYESRCRRPNYNYSLVHDSFTLPQMLFALMRRVVFQERGPCHIQVPRRVTIIISHVICCTLRGCAAWCLLESAYEFLRTLFQCCLLDGFSNHFSRATRLRIVQSQLRVQCEIVAVKLVGTLALLLLVSFTLRL